MSSSNCNKQNQQHLYMYPHARQANINAYTNNPNLINQTQIKSVYHPNTFLPSVVNNSSMYPCNAYIPPTCATTNYPSTPFYVLQEFKMQQENERK